MTQVRNFKYEDLTSATITLISLRILNKVIFFFDNESASIWKVVIIRAQAASSQPWLFFWQNIGLSCFHSRVSRNYFKEYIKYIRICLNLFKPILLYPKKLATSSAIHYLQSAWRNLTQILISVKLTKCEKELSLYNPFVIVMIGGRKL